MTAEERYQQCRWSILAQACYEAPIGIWEPYWWANNVLRDLPVEDRLAWAERAMLELLTEHLIRFYRQAWSSGDRSHPLSGAAAMTLIRGDVWRHIPLEQAEIWFEATPQGDRKMGQATEAKEWLGEASVAPGWSQPVEDA